MKELDTVVLEQDLPEHGLKKGDIGTVVLVHWGAGYEVEFATLHGKTFAVISLLEDKVRGADCRGIAHSPLVAI